MKCGSEKNIHVDHIKPRSIYFKDELNARNLQILCKTCNIEKSFVGITDYRTKEHKRLLEIAVYHDSVIRRYYGHKSEFKFNKLKKSVYLKKSVRRIANRRPKHKVHYLGSFGRGLCGNKFKKSSFKPSEITCVKCKQAVIKYLNYKKKRIKVKTRCKDDK